MADHTSRDVAPPFYDSIAAESATLSARIRAGDATAYTVAFRAYYLLVVRFLVRYVHSADVAEDIAQDTFVRLWERRADIDPSRSLKAYLMTSARNQALNALRHDNVVQQRAADTLAELGKDAEVSPVPTGEEAVVLNELVQLRDAQLATLPARQREVYQLSRIDGLTTAEIAELLGISVSTVHVLLGRALRAFQPLLARWIREGEGEG